MQYYLFVELADDKPVALMHKFNERNELNYFYK